MMRYFYLIFVPYLLFGTSDMFCLVCHGGNQIRFSKLKYKSEWVDLTSDGGKKLQKIHKDNIDVKAYFKSDNYDEKALFKYVSFFSRKIKKNDPKPFFKKCFVCHRNNIHMSSFYTKQQWQELNHSLKNLIHTHQYQLDVVKDLKSQQFKNVLPEFIDDITFHAPNNIGNVRKDTYYIPPKQDVKSTIVKKNKEKETQKRKTKKISLKITDDTNLTVPPKSQMRQIKRKHFSLSYEKGNLRKEQARIILQKLHKKWKSVQKKQNKINITLYRTGTQMYTSDFFVSLFTVGLAPVRYADTWVMKVTLGDDVYYAKSDVVTVHGILADDAMEDNELLSEKVIAMFEYALFQAGKFTK